MTFYGDDIDEIFGYAHSTFDSLCTLSMIQQDGVTHRNKHIDDKFNFIQELQQASNKNMFT